MFQKQLFLAQVDHSDHSATEHTCACMSMAIVQEKKKISVFCNALICVLTWQCILIIYFKSLCKKVGSLTLLIFLINYNE